jgi:chromosome segregation ATPase
MKTPLVVASLFVVLALIASCKPAPDQPAGDGAKTAAASADKAAVAAKDTEPRVQDYAYAQKVDFVASMQAKLESLNRGIDELATKLESSSATVKAEAAPKLAALREEAKQLKQQIDAAQSATEATWADLKTGVQKSYAATKAGFDQARQWASEKIAP